MSSTALVLDVLQMSIGSIFVYSGLAKLRRPASFAEGVRAYQIVPEDLAVVVAVAILLGELFIGFTHLTGLLLGAGTVACIALILTFAAAIGVNLMRGHAVPCYCTGSGEEELISGRALVRLCAMLAVEVSLLWTVHAGIRVTGAPWVSTGAFIDVFVVFGWSLVTIEVCQWVLMAPELWELARRRVAFRH